MSRIEVVKGGALSTSTSTPGVTRHLAFEEDSCRVLRSRAEPGVVSGWHHHGDYDVYGYVVSGSAQLDNATEGNSMLVQQGDFFHVPARMIHREVNPSPNQNCEVILFLCGSGPIVVNVDAPKS